MIDQLWELLEQWYQIAADEMIGDNTRHTYRECANQLDDILGTYTKRLTVTDADLEDYPGTRSPVGPLDEYRGQ